MPWQTAPLETLNEAHLQQLIADRVAEGRDLEYKLQLPGGSDGEKKEFLADVSSFANTVGGHILFGVREETGFPVDIPGLSVPDPDAERLRFENILRTGIDPRLAGVSIATVRISNGNIVMGLRIARSWSAPHMVIFGGSSRFYGRNSAGKYPLDVRELRSAFLLGERTSEKIRQFRLDRIAKIKANELPIPLQENPRVVLHIVPVDAFEARIEIDTSELRPDSTGFQPMYSDQRDYRHNFDGILVFPGRGEGAEVHSYLQIFRNGVLEAVNASMIYPDADQCFIRSVVVEPELIDSLRNYIGLERILGMNPPFVVMLSLLGVKGYRVMPNTHNRHWTGFRVPIDRPDLLMSDFLVESQETDPSLLLRPAFDEIWNAAGWEGSHNYGEDGTYRRLRY